MPTGDKSEIAPIETPREASWNQNLRENVNDSEKDLCIQRFLYFLGGEKRKIKF